MIQIDELVIGVGAFRLGPLSLNVSDGEYFVLLGPNGTGKTMLLRALTGLLRVRAGRIRIDKRDVTHTPPRDRLLGYVPQDYGLFPHLDVLENVTFALRSRGVGRAEARRQAAPLIDLLKLDRFLDRSVGGLSGGERQKVALARALASRPLALLLDEPVSAIDIGDRFRLYRELRRLQRELGVTTIHVTHSLEEALAVSDRAGVLLDGRLAQAGPTAELLTRPSTEAVARFVRVENVLEADAAPAPEGGSVLTFAGSQLACNGSHSGRVRFVVRPNFLHVAPTAPPVGNAVHATLSAVIDRAAYWSLEFDAGQPIVVYATAPDGPGRWQVGQSYQIVFPRDALHVLG